ncbi:MAG: UDP-glucose/GDP-mannose dehydrogenase family protein [Candidatus Woesearchaeota archaeon]
MKISIFGSGYVGLVTGACLADLGHEILCVDVDEKKINQLEQADIPFHEPGLKDLVIRNKSKGRLRFSTNIEEGVLFGEVIFNCVGTPGKEDGSADLTYVFSVAESVAKFAEGYKILINKSTVPPSTAKKCSELIKQTNPISEVEVVSNPEFLAEGKAVYDFTHPDKIVVGAKTSKAFSLLRKIYTGRVRTYIPILETDWETAEVIKYANNSFLSTKISFINEIANVCDKMGADVKIVAQAIGMDYRISPKFLNAGIGYGGSCFPKDVRALAKAAEEYGYDAKLLKEVDALNRRQRMVLFNKLKERFPDLNEKIITIWGLSFKPKTSDIREAPSLDIIQELLKFGVKINVVDPIAIEEVKAFFSDNPRNLNYCTSIEESVKDSSAILLLTEWDEFRNVNFSEIGKEMKQKIIFDGRNIYEPELVKEEGFEYYGVGRR